MAINLITASRLRDGAAVWYGETGTWGEDVDGATAFEDMALATALEDAQRDAAGRIAVDVHATPTEPGKRVLPTTPRERMRASGPSVRADLAHRPRPPVRAPLLPPPSTRSRSPFAGVYRYDDYDRQFLRDRAAQFGRQVARRLAGELSEDEFKPLRLMNGLYLQLHGYMLRVALPYGVVSATRCASSPMWPVTSTAATAISPPARACSSTGRGWRKRPASSRSAAWVKGAFIGGQWATRATTYA